MTNIKIQFHTKTVKTSDDRSHKTFTVTVFLNGGKMELSEAMAVGLGKLTFAPRRISDVDMAVYTAQSLSTRRLVDFSSETMEVSITGLGLEIVQALRASGKCQ